MNVDASESAPDPRLAAWRRLADDSSRSFLEAVDDLVHAGITPAAIARLRRTHPDAPVAEAIELVEARRRAGTKFGESRGLLLDRAGLEQASSRMVADWKAARFGDRPVLDLCCGVGGDAMALAARGPCTGVDRDPVRAFMTSRNASIPTRVEDVAETTIDAPLVHVDPARRDERSGRRSWDLEDLVPSLDRIAAIVAAADGAAVKLGPGLPMPAPVVHPRQSLSVVSEGGRLVQAVLWTGCLARSSPVEAVDLPSGRTFEGEPSRSHRGAAGVGDVWLEFHPAIERLGLGPAFLASLDAGLPERCGEPAPGLGLLTGDRDLLEVPGLLGGTPWVRAVEIHRSMPARLDRVARAVDAIAREVAPRGIVVRTRGGAIDTDAWHRRLARGLAIGSGPMLEVGGWRLGRRTVATIGIAPDARDHRSVG